MVVLHACTSDVIHAVASSYETSILEELLRVRSSPTGEEWIYFLFYEHHRASKNPEMIFDRFKYLIQFDIEIKEEDESDGKYWYVRPVQTGEQLKFVQSRKRHAKQRNLIILVSLIFVFIVCMVIYLLS